MGGLKIDCPLCCDKNFDSKEALVEHLNKVLDNIFCPLCNTKWASLEGLTEHLSLYDCQNVQNPTTQSIVLYEQTTDVNSTENTEENKNSESKSQTEASPTHTESEYITGDTFECQTENGELNKVYVEFLSKQVSKPMLQTQELKLIKEDGETRYMIVTQDDGEICEDSAIVTKRNNDGTISLTTVKDIKLESETLISPEQNAGESQEMYNCNACKLSFTSVMDHINNYHNDQEVLVEELPPSMEATENTSHEVPVTYEPTEMEDDSTSTEQIRRRVITETGDIVEEPMILKCEVAEANTDTKEKPECYHKVITKELHTKSGFKLKMYVCMACNLSVANLRDFSTHPCATSKYPCPRCPAAYENPKSLCAHMKVHKLKVGAIADGNPDVPIIYECEVCSTIFPTNKSLKLHKRMHDPVKSRPIEAPVKNVDGKETTGGLYRCNTCDKMIPFDYLSIHENSHKANNKINCRICNKKFNSAEYLEMHMNVHNLDKVTVNKQDKSLPYKCTFCNRRFARPHEKVKHERIHTGEKPHSCEICGKSFRVSYCLTLHMRTHTGARPYACPHCGKRFKAHSGYNHHLLTHSEVRAYKCPFCPKAFKTSVQLAGHKNSHTKPFSCQHCNRPFASLYAVRVHSETHARQNNLKFSCPLCGASYARAFALNDHVKQVHKQNSENASEFSLPEETWVVQDNGEEDSQDMDSLNKELTQDILT